MLRKHQKEFHETIAGIISGSGIKTVYCSVCPGGGKSILPIIAGKLIESGLADKLIWIAPRLSLIDQAEREFINPYFRQILEHRMEIRASTNEYNPCRDRHGFATTYNAVGLDDGILLDEFTRRRYILICDEFHHVQENSLWHKRIAPLFALAKYRIMLSGTLERGDGTRIGFMPYKMNGAGLIPDLQDKEEVKVIRYTREDALRERAIIPLSFHLNDGQVSWQARTGRNVHVASMDRMTEYDASKAIYTALHTEFAEDLLRAGLAHWQTYRTTHPGAKCLIVCSDIKQAKRHAETLSRWGVSRFEIATSDDSDTALAAIKKMKAGKLDILVAVAMIYEGLDVPSASHVICLTRIRSTPWIEQCVSRTNRIDNQAGPYDTQCGHIFAPSDPLFKQIVDRIEAEQLPFLTDREGQAGNGKPKADNDDFVLEAQAPGGIKPLSSRMTNGREILLANKKESFPAFDDCPTRSSSEIEADLLEQIENHIRTYSFQNRHNPKRLNAEVYAHFGKKRREMTIEELQGCLSHIRGAYPLSYIRGTGIKRVPTKAVPVTVEWRMPYE